MESLASIIINNYNYGRFLKDAIESALDQTYRYTEVIVVDDGSTDNSREIVDQYRDRIAVVLKENGGQASAFNAGFARSRGEVICFLDADDRLVATAIEQAVCCFREPGTTKVHWPLWIVNEDGRRTDKLLPGSWLPEGDLQDVILRNGPWGYATPPTSGNAWARQFLEHVFPIPEEAYRLCADAYLWTLAPLFGLVKSLSKPQGFYRLHGQNHYRSQRFEEKLRSELQLYNHQCEALSVFCGELNLNADLERWMAKSWPHRLYESIQEIKALISRGDTFVLVDQDQWGTPRDFFGRWRLPFLEQNGIYWGPPPNDATAIRELERLCRQGAKYLVFGWPAFWWLDHYAEFHGYLWSNFSCVLRNERLIVFHLG